MSSLTGNEVEQLHEEYVLQPWSVQGRPTLPIQKAEGIYFWDYDGKKYADMSSLLVCANLGHSNEAIKAVITEQMQSMCFMAPVYATEAKSKLAKLLVDVAGAETYGRVFFTSGGADSNENAIKMARIVTGRTKIFSEYRSYHGSTLGAGHASGDWRRFADERGGASGFVHFLNPHMYQDGYTRGVDDAACTAHFLRLLEQQLHFEGTENVAAILMETIVGANGVLVPPKGYMEGIRKICDKYGILLICDEVMAGFGRTGKMFAWQNFDIKPDLITFAKGVTSGYLPLGGVIANKRVAGYFEHHLLPCGLTYSGHTLACAAGVAAVTYYREHQICEHVQEVAPILHDFLDKMVEKHPCVGEARHIGLFSALEIVKDKASRTPIVAYGEKSPIMPSIMAELKKRGFSTFGRENNINICPPLIITAQELQAYLPILDDVLTWVDQTYLN